MANQAASPTGAATASPVGPSTGGPAQGNNMASLPGLWAKAMLSPIISEEERNALDWMSENAQQLQTPAGPINGLIAVLQQKQDKCQRNRWHVRIGDRDIILRDVAAKIISVLDVFKAVGDTAVQADPGGAALPWALIRFLLQAAVEERNQMYALLSVVESVSRISARCRVYELLFVAGAVPNQTAYGEMQDALVAAYAHVLKAIAHTSSRLEQHTIKKAWTAVIRPRETSEIVQELERCDDHVRAAAASCTSVQVHGIDAVTRGFKNQLSLGLDSLGRHATDSKGDMQALNSKIDALNPGIKQIQQKVSDVDARSESLRRVLETMKLPLFRIDRRVSEHLKEVDKERKFKILDWVSRVKFGDHHKSASDSRTPGTCDWLLEDSRFVDWHASSSSVVLLLYGSPGTGKTYLVSRLVDWLEEGLHKAKSDEAFAFFYCNRNEESRRNPVQVLRSIVRQLANPRATDKRGTIHQKIHDHYNVGRETATELNFDACMGVLKEFIDTYPQTTIVLDALDECEKECRHVLMKLFDDLLSYASRPVKLFIASRPDVDIREHFLERSFINIRATDNHDDVSKYIQAEVQKHPRWSKLNQRLRAEISSTLLRRSDGMFQWAALQVRQLLRLRTENAIRDRLGRLPKDLKDAYDEIYEEIENLHSEDKQIAHRAFQWVMCAETPLGRKALLHAVCQDPALAQYQEPLEEVDENLILELCHNLLVFDTDLDYWRVSHLSVIEYFEENQLHDVRVADCNAAKVCLSILLTTSLWPKSDWETMQAYKSMQSRLPLIDYALLSWQTHILSVEALLVGEADERVEGLLEEFAGYSNKPSPSYAHWHEFLVQRYSESNDISFIYMAIYMARQTVEYHNPKRASPLAMLAHVLYLSFKCSGEAADLRESIQTGRDALSAMPGDHIYRVLPLRHLANALLDSCTIRLTEETEHVDEVVCLMEDALRITPSNDPDRALLLYETAECFTHRFAHTGRYADFAEARKLLLAALYTQNGDTSILINTARNSLLAFDLGTIGPQETYSAATSFVELIPLSINPEDDQYFLSHSTKSISDAAALALELGKGAATAVKMLETGRGVIARTLQAILVRRWPSLEQSVTAIEENKIRDAAAYGRGPIVMVNVSRYRCDALIIEVTRIRSVELPLLKRRDIVGRINAGDIDSIGTLGWLWDVVVGPVLNALGISETPADGHSWPRLCWVPTGPLVLFPLHAAGHHLSQDSATALDRVVSSYSSSVKTIISAHQQHSFAEFAEPFRLEKRHLGDSSILDWRHHPSTWCLSPTQHLQSRNPLLVYGSYKPDVSTPSIGTVVDESMYLSHTLAGFRHAISALRHARVNDAVYANVMEEVYYDLPHNGISDRSDSMSSHYFLRSLRDQWVAGQDGSGG